ncbi:cell division protein ZapA [Thermoanaerobacter uzonensis DSM 18761]|uniref:Cell division protein ZapA n=1 Tax=Thermoanaerobacter uzonensis DSM 18761 TaxID=1123369 RepID=A0A1M4WQU9_9THEO|nr:cell division protein ZapA [Thermoanaerobacter uzonensis]SHE83560.1 cell division protein ZapA [Thermoanaerobacter uzonensis DSM 18761]
MELNKVTVIINGNEYILKSDYPEEHVIKLANYVDNVIKELLQNYKKLSQMQLLLLSSLNIADELFIAREENNAIKKELLSLKAELEEKNRYIRQLEEELTKTKQQLLETEEEFRQFIETFDKEK